MKKIIAVLCIIALSAGVAEARPHGSFHHHGGIGGHSYHYAPKHHHGGNVAAGLAIGLIGGSIINAALSQPRTVTTTTYNPISYAPAISYAPTIVPAPIVAPVAVNSTTVTTSPCYTTTNIVTGATSTACSSTIITNNPVTSQIWIAN